MTELELLTARFPLPGLRFEAGNGGLIRAVVKTSTVAGELYLHGAHVTHFQPAGFAPVLWMSAESLFEADKPIRGGVPICFPWFGPHGSDSKAPGHGWARLKPWEVKACGLLNDGGVSLELQTTIEEFELTYRVHFGRSLQMLLIVELPATANESKRFEEALHTYLSVGEVRQVAIEGLESKGYIDKVGGLTQRDATGVPIKFSGETDRVYLDTPSTCGLRDDNLKRTISIRKAGSKSTVVWNPWIEKSQRMPDFGDQEWPGMVCIETANVAANSVELRPGETHTLRAEIAVSEIT